MSATIGTMNVKVSLSIQHLNSALRQMGERFAEAGEVVFRIPNQYRIRRDEKRRAAAKSALLNHVMKANAGNRRRQMHH